MSSVISSQSLNAHSVIKKLLCSSSKHPTVGNTDQSPLFVELVQERNFSQICSILADPATSEEWISFGAELYAAEAPTPLHLLCLYRPNPAVAKAVLEAHWTFDLYVEDGQGRTPLHVAVQQGVDTDVVQLLLGDEFSSAAAVQDSLHLRYPLHYACCVSSDRIARRLSIKSKVNAPAADNNSLLTVRRLLDVYPEAVHKVDREGKTPIDLARSNRQIDPRILSRLEFASRVLAIDKEYEGVWEGEWHTPQHLPLGSSRSNKTSSKVNNSTAPLTADMTTTDWFLDRDSFFWPLHEVAPAKYVDDNDDLSTVGSRGVSVAQHRRPSRIQSSITYSRVEL